MGDLTGDLNWKKISEMTETVSDSYLAISIKGKAKY